MASIDELKRRIDLHDLADKLDLKRGKGTNQNYHAPGHKDEKPSLSIFNKDGKVGWKDWSSDTGGSCVDLVMHVEGGDVSSAVKRLHELYGIPFDKPATPAERVELSRAEYIAERCMPARAKAIDYLVQERKISEDVARRAVEKGAVGYNDYTSPTTLAGEHGHGGPAVAFIVRTLNPGRVVAVDMRYIDPALNGGTKTQCQGDKAGQVWTSDIKRLLAAKTVYFVESSINALSVECCHLYDTAVVAILGTGNAASIPLDWMRGKQAIICMDNDEPFAAGHKLAGYRPGLSAAWVLHERMTALDISALLVDQDDWVHNDVNDVLKAEGAEKLKKALQKLEPWLIPGMAGKVDEQGGKPRLFLPSYHFHKYSEFRVKPDFTSIYGEKTEEDEDGNKKKIPFYADLSGFRVASMSRVTIASATATMAGDDDSQPRTMFAVSVQTTRHGAQLQRRVVDDEKLHNIDTWKKFGPVWNQSQFLRLVNILENAAHIGARKAANFVGLCWRDGRLIVNEGPDCYFTNPDQQCPYHNLTFPSGPRGDARKVIAAYQGTFGKNAALIPLVWGLGGHLKVLLGFWPHLQLQASKGAGKSTLIKRLERTIGFTMFSGQSLQTEFRLLTSISHTSHPVGWEELSARRQDIIDKAIALLQENYQYTVNRRGADMTEFLLSAPVLLAGEDVPVRSLIGKLVRSELKVKGAMMDDELPRFPVKEWLKFLTGFTPSQVRGIYGTFREQCQKMSRAKGDDDGAVRMSGNYAAVLTAWRLLCEFAEIDIKQGDFPTDLMGEMNAHIAETSSDREPWVWIMETLLHELATSNYKAPYLWGRVGDEDCLILRTSDVMHHLSSTPALREAWNALPVKSDRIFKKQLTAAGVIINDSVERTIGQRRVAHMAAISLSKLGDYGLHAARAELMEAEPPAGTYR